MSVAEQASVNQWTGHWSTQTWTPCFVYDGVTSKSGRDMYQACHNKGPSVTIIRTKTGRRFGGYLSSGWLADSFVNNAGWYKEDKSRLFSLDYKEVSSPVYYGVAVLYLPKWGPSMPGPSWGKGPDIAVSSSLKTGTMAMGKSYRAVFKGCGSACKYWFAGAPSFGVSRIEVFYRDK